MAGDAFEPFPDPETSAKNDEIQFHTTESTPAPPFIDGPTSNAIQHGVEVKQGDLDYDAKEEPEIDPAAFFQDVYYNEQRRLAALNAASTLDNESVDALLAAATKIETYLRGN